MDSNSCIYEKSPDSCGFCFSDIFARKNIKGRFVIAGDFYSQDYKYIYKRRNLVYLPPEYFENPDQSFPVIYWFDGQNIWDYEKSAFGGWKADSTMEKLVSQGKSRPFIIASLFNSVDRDAEYAGWCKGSLEYMKNQGQNTEKYPEFSREHDEMLVKDYISYIEGNFRCIKKRENRIVAGSSYGAFYCAHLLEKYPEIFGGAGLFSGGLSGYQEIIDKNGLKNKDFKIFLSCGDGDELEKELISGTRNLKDYLLKEGYALWNPHIKQGGKVLCYGEYPHALHNEWHWSQRVPLFLEFISRTI